MRGPRSIPPGTFYDRTFGFQVDRDSPFSIWARCRRLGWLRTLLLVATAGLSLALAAVPRRKSVIQVAALGAALMLALQITMKHWFYLYIPWFYPLLLVALAAVAVSPARSRNPQPARSSRPALAVDVDHGAHHPDVLGAVSKRVGIWVISAASACSALTPRMPAREPVMPTSVMWAVPPRKPARRRWGRGCGCRGRRRPARRGASPSPPSRGHLGVEVDDERVGLEPGEDAVGGVEGGAGDLQPGGAAEVDDPDPHPGRLHHRVAAAGVALRVVGGADHPPLAVEEGVGLAVAVDVVAGGDDAGAGGEDVVGGALGDPHAAGRVLAVDDDQVRRLRLAQRRRRVAQPPPPGAADDVADEEQPHGRLRRRARLHAGGGPERRGRDLGAGRRLPLRGAAALVRPSRRGDQELVAHVPDLEGRRQLLCYGANAAPPMLARKLATLPHEPLPLLRPELSGFDVVYSAHVSPYGAVPGTLQRSPGTTVPVFVAYATTEQEELLTATEPNYELRRLHDPALQVDKPASWTPSTPT